MKAGKFILGLQALEVVASHAKDVQNAKLFLASIAIAKTKQRQAELGVPCGSTYRARFVEGIENIEFAGSISMDGFLIEYKIGPNPPVEDRSKYVYLHYFGQVDEQKMLVQFYKIDNFPELDDSE